MASNTQSTELAPIDTEGPLDIRQADPLNPLANSKRFWVSNPPQTQAEKLLLIKSFGGQVAKLSSMINKVIPVRNVGRQHVVMTDRETCEVRKGIRTLLFCDGGDVYGCVSEGVSNSLALIFGGWGQPPYDPPLQLLVKQVELAGGNRLLQLEIDESALQA